MKKLKKILAVISAAIVAGSMAVAPVSVYAQNSYDILDISKDKLKLVISNETSTGRNELWIDDTYRYLMAHMFKTTVAVRMTDGTEPSSPAESNFSIVQKLTDIQKVNMLCVESVWFMDADNIKLSDDLYVVNGFKTAEAAEEYCQELIHDGKADYAEPIVTGEYSYCYPANKTLLDYFKSAEIDYDESKLDEINTFSKESFIFSVICKDETATIEYLKENIDGFEECVSIATENNSSIYFQLKNSADDQTKINILKQMCMMENISKPIVPMYSQLTNISNTQINSMLENYKAGDANMNEKIDLYDAVEIAKSVIGIREFSDAELILADFNNDSEVNIYDAIEISKTLIE